MTLTFPNKIIMAFFPPHKEYRSAAGWIIMSLSASSANLTDFLCQEALIRTRVHKKSLIKDHLQLADQQNTHSHLTSVLAHFCSVSTG